MEGEEKWGGEGFAEKIINFDDRKEGEGAKYVIRCWLYIDNVNTTLKVNRSDNRGNVKYFYTERSFLYTRILQKYSIYIYTYIYIYIYIYLWKKEKKKTYIDILL